MRAVHLWWWCLGRIVGHNGVMAADGMEIKCARIGSACMSARHHCLRRNASRSTSRASCAGAAMPCGGDDRADEHRTQGLLTATR